MADITSPAMMEVNPDTLRMPHPVGDGNGQLVQAIKPLPVKGSTITRLIPIPGVLAAAQYAANDQVGQGITIPDVARFAGGGGIIESVVLFETTTQQIAADLFLFDENLPVGDIAADNAAASVTDNTMRNTCIGAIPISSYFPTGVNAIGVARGVGLAFQCRDNENSLYALLVTRGAPTYGVGGLTLKVVILQD